MVRPIILLDRDGVINANRADYVKSWAEFQFLPGALEALQALAELGWSTVVVTNQSAIGRGLVPQATVDQIHQKMLATVHEHGGRLERVFYCPHHPADGCDCRKPRAGLLHQAQSCLQADLSHSILIGDALSDVEAARAVGCTPILVKSGRGRQQLSLLSSSERDGLLIAEDLAGAVSQIFSLLPRETKRSHRPHAENSFS